MSLKPKLLTKLYLARNCVIAIHPDRTHEYKYTKPMPMEEKQHSVLKEDAKNMITNSPNLDQIRNLTYTPYRYWHQRQGKEKRDAYKALFDDNKDRPGLTS